MERNGEAGREIRRSGSAEEDKNPNRATASAMQLREARSVHNGFCTEEWGCMQRQRVHCGKQAYAAGWFSFKQTADELMLPHKLLFLYSRVLAALAFDTICLSVCLSVLEWSIRVALDLLSPQWHHSFTCIVGMNVDTITLKYITVS